MAETKLPPKDYQRILNGIQVTDLVFRKIEASFEDFSPGDEKIMISVSERIALSPKDGEKAFSSRVQVEVSGVLKEQTILSIKLEMLCRFLAEEEVTQPFLEIFRSNGLSLIVQPYFRKMVHSITSEMGLPPLYLPIWTPLLSEQVETRQAKPRRKSI